MATDSRRRLAYHQRLFLLLLGFSWILGACFILFQYGREKQFKAENLNAQLQLFNMQLLDALDDGKSPAQFIARHKIPAHDLRVTVMALDGRVLYDSSETGDSVTLPNHLQRPEVVAALQNGTGYTVQRLSQSTRDRYFYSAMRGDAFIVRSARPYTVSLTGILSADREFLWFMLGLTLLMSVTGYIATHRLGQNINRLRLFARQAEKGEIIGERATFLHDELGDISNNIIRLYARLQKAIGDRDREHAAAQHEQQEKIRIKKQLTNNINHELKTPVAVIQGYLETILNNPDMNPDTQKAFIEKSYAQSERLHRLLLDISTVTRMDEASHLLQRETVVVDDLIAEIASEVALLPEERRLRIHCDFPHPILVEGNLSLLHSIFHNLTDNATAYSSGRDIFIRLLDETDDSYTFLFADNGIGVDEEHLPHLFERFYRVDKGRSRKMGGTGLGLAIVKNAVVLHGGSIEAHNSDKGGLEFIFSLRKHSALAEG
ncbi:MAG: ATP-binding protein [Alistipes sp.]